MGTEESDMQRGVQVVKVGNRSYELDEQALEKILMREDIKDLPVVLVSIAGDYRGGKSFLLDFFLRYLRSSPSKQESRKWLGDDGEPLEGFTWCGGSELNTTGILLWSQPIHASLPSGQKVAVLLMDTQGTFDSTSTVRDCSTIFALSTLLSSVQIYNLSKLIKEDDLQHLQLFTEYGKLARNEDGKAFQTLQFLVRDWSCSYDHPFGAAGGQQLLDKRLEVRDDQHEELREIRQHILTSFESVRCFLMPHPGLTVATNPNFVGHLSDISTEFKESLLELVTSIFETKNLTPKLINGQYMKAQDLFYYFKSYINMFNSDKLPTPLTIMKATMEAGILTALKEAREQYEAEMERECGAGQPSVPPAALRELHGAARAAAAAAFTNKKKMGSQLDADAHLERLMQELQSRLQQYMSLNDAKIQKATEEAKEIYERSMIGEQRQCLHPTELDEAHQNSVKEALNFFDSTRKQQSVDNEREELVKELNGRLAHYKTINNMNISNAVADAKVEYERVVWNGYSENRFCLHPQHLVEYHQSAVSAAIKCFDSHWRTTPIDQHEKKAELLQSTEEKSSRLKAINVANNKKAVQVAISYYEMNMKLISGYDLPCLNSDDLNHEHQEARQNTIIEFYRSRTYGEQDYPQDKYKEEIVKKISLLYLHFYEINGQVNKVLIEEAHSRYCNAMEVTCQTTPFAPNMNPDSFSIGMQHENAKSDALQLFQDRRRTGLIRQNDSHRNELLEKIQNSYTTFQVKFYGSKTVEIVSTTVAGAGALAAMLFLKP